MPSKEAALQQLNANPLYTADPQEAARRAAVLTMQQQAILANNPRPTPEQMQQLAAIAKERNALLPQPTQAASMQSQAAAEAEPLPQGLQYDPAGNQQQKMEELQKGAQGYADGGEVPAALDPNPPSVADQVMQSVPQAQSEQPSAPALQQSGYNPVSPFQQAIQAQVGAIRDIANAQSQQAKETGAAEEQAANFARDSQTAYQSAYDTLSHERAAFIQDLQNQQIDPNRYMHEMGAGQKVATAVGLLLSGFGSGLAHQPNAALKFLDDQINRDIASQHAELGKKENLLSANARQFGELGQATAMTRIMHNDYVSHLIAQAAAKSASPIAQAQAQQAIGQLGQQSAMLQHQLSLAGSTSASGNVQNPSALVPLMVPEKQQEGAFKEAGRAQDAAGMYNNVMQEFEKANQENTVGGRVMHLGAAPASATNMMNMMMPVLKDNEGRINETEVEMMKDFVPSPGDSTHKVNEKREGLRKFILSKMATPTLSGYGIPGVKKPKDLDLRPGAK